MDKAMPHKLFFTLSLTMCVLRALPSPTGWWPAVMTFSPAASAAASSALSHLRQQSSNDWMGAVSGEVGFVFHAWCDAFIM